MNKKEMKKRIKELELGVKLSDRINDTYQIGLTGIAYYVNFDISTFPIPDKEVFAIYDRVVKLARGDSNEN